MNNVSDIEKNPPKSLLMLLASIVALSPLAIDMYLPAMPALADAFGTTISMVQNSLSIYLFGYTLGLLVFGPLADKFPRRTMVFIGIFGFFLASILLINCQTINQFIAIRFAQAFVSSAAIVIVPSVIREYYGSNTAKGLSYVSMIMMLAPMIAPSIGSGLLLLHSWKLIFLLLTLYSVIVLVLAMRYLPEKNEINKTVKVKFLSRYFIVLSNKKIRFDLITSMMSSLAFFTYLTTISFVYMTVFKLSEFYFSLFFAFNVMALITAHFVNTRMVVSYGSRKMLYYGLILSVIMSALLVIVTYFSLSLSYTVIVIFFLMAGITMISVNTDALTLTAFKKEQSGTVSAVLGIGRFGAGALAGPILSLFYDGSALPFSLLMCGAILAVLACQITRFVTYGNYSNA